MKWLIETAVPNHLNGHTLCWHFQAGQLQVAQLLSGIQIKPYNGALLGPIINTHFLQC